MSEPQETTPSEAKKYKGSCHCGAVRFEVDLDLEKGATRCNCSVCTKIMQTGVLIKPDALRVLSGEGDLSTYEWASRMSTRFFCKHCGVHCFGKGHLAELGGDFASVNVNCLDDVDVNGLPLMFWDGRHDNWQAGPRQKPWPIFRTA